MILNSSTEPPDPWFPDEFNVFKEYYHVYFLIFDVHQAAVSLPFQVHRLQVLACRFLNASFGFADEEGSEKAQNGSFSNLLKICASHLYVFLKATRRRLLASSLCCHASFISASTPGPGLQPCAPRRRIEHGASLTTVENMTSAMSMVTWYCGNHCVRKLASKVRLSHQPPEVPFLPVWCKLAWDAVFRVYEILIRFWRLQGRPVDTNAANESAVSLLC